MKASEHEKEALELARSVYGTKPFKAKNKTKNWN